jgi:uncharacterized protein YciI
MKMNSLVAALLMAVSCGFAQISVPPHTSVQIRLNIDPLYVSLLRPVHGANAVPANLIAEHAEYWKSIASRGTFVLFGPVSGGMLDRVVVYHASNEDQALQMARKDPLVRRKQLVAKVGKWLTDFEQLRKSRHTDYFLGFLTEKRKQNLSYQEWSKRNEAETSRLSQWVNDGKLVAFGGLWTPVESWKLRDRPCPLDKGGTCSSWTGLNHSSTTAMGLVLLFHTDTLADAQRLAAEEPEVKSGAARVVLYQWTLTSD